jgi:hypothetical protein
VGLRQRLKTLETGLRKTSRLPPNASTNLWRRPTRSSFAGTAEPVETSEGPTAETRGPTTYLFRDVPAERKSSQASTTRCAMPASATFPQARGSYAFLLPTSPSTFSTPS